jgi:hypothetical protein
VTTEEFIAAVDWAKVVADMRETRAEIDTTIAQHIAEVRAAGRPERLRDKEQLARLQDNADLLDAFITWLDG